MRRATCCRRITCSLLLIDDADCLPALLGRLHRCHCELRCVFLLRRSSSCLTSSSSSSRRPCRRLQLNLDRRKLCACQSFCELSGDLSMVCCKHLLLFAAEAATCWILSHEIIELFFFSSSPSLLLLFSLCSRTVATLKCSPSTALSVTCDFLAVVVVVVVVAAAAVAGHQTHLAGLGELAD